MGTREWTQDQKNAINVRNRTILVSAAAGSGKTASLAQRVINKITDKNNPSDADKLLIVTFTKAAAAEMKDRIASLLSDMIEENPKNISLRRQQSLLKNANICTVHSFCSNIVKENFYKLGISPNFRIADDNEISIIEEKAIKKVLDKFYEKEDTHFFQLVELFSNEKEDKALVNIVLKLYKFVVSYPFYEEWFNKKRQDYNNHEICNTMWGKVLLDYAFDVCEFCEKCIQESINLLQQNEELIGFYSQALSSDMSQIANLKRQCSTKSWDDLIESLKNFKKARRKNIPTEYKESYEIFYVEARRENIKKALDKLKKYFCFPLQRCQKDLENIRPVMDTLFEVTQNFISELNLIKSSKNIAEFSDLEKWMIDLLAYKDGNGEIHKSESAQEISDYYDEIMVDEYQDTNEIQDMIFKLISKSEKNLFMVGDVKQSIYGFRQAMPQIFMDKKAQYSLYDQNENDEFVKIILSKNFRSRKGIIDCVNFIFKKIMSKNIGGIDYNQEEMLISGAKYKESSEPDTHIEILELSENDDMDKAEAIRISQIISSMVESGHLVKDGSRERPVTYRDFCVLLRSANKRGCTYAKELNDRGIPAWSDAGGKFFGTWEVACMLSLLRVIDNPIQDIPLLSVLISPLFGFTAEDLSDIRLEKKDVPLYFGVKSLADKGDRKCMRFMEKIDKYRRLCSFLAVGKLINYIYEDTGYTSIVLAMTNGRLRLANLRMLAEYASKYDGAVYKGLSGFIGFIDKLEQKKSDLSPASTVSEASNVVKIMSIHKSKGLEFPICIIARCSGKFNKEHSDVVLHGKLGLGVNLKDKKDFVKHPNFMRNAVLLETEKDEISEELRVLYVAMTRAKEKLIFLISLKNLQKSVQTNIMTNNDAIESYTVRNSSSFSDWILKCILSSKSAKDIYDFAGIKLPANTQKKPDLNFSVKITKLDEHEDVQELNQNQIIPNTKLPEHIQKRFDFVYPYSDINHIPSKIAASKLAHADEWVNYIASSKPQFMSDLQMTPQERGTAFHQFLHFVDYSYMRDDVSDQIKTLKDKGLLTENQASAINLSQARAFLSSELAERIRNSDRVLREYRFTVSVPVGDINSIEDIKTIHQDKENVLIQGAIDCSFKEGNHYIIVDYKTDKIKDLADLKDKYSRQLYIYKHAFELCEEASVKELLIYSIPLNQCISV